MEKLIKLSDDELVRKFVQGDKSSIGVLVERHKSRIFSYILLIVKQNELAEDIFQDAFVKVIKSLHQGKYIENGRFCSWVMRISHNLIIDHFRKQKNLSVISNDNYDHDLLNSSKFADQTVEDKIVFEQLLTEVGLLVDLLPETQREVVKYRYFLGLSFKDIADETGVSINTALGRMRYALLNMRKLMEEKNVSLTI